MASFCCTIRSFDTLLQQFPKYISGITMTFTSCCFFINNGVIRRAPTLHHFQTRSQTFECSLVKGAFQFFSFYVCTLSFPIEVWTTHRCCVSFLTQVFLKCRIFGQRGKQNFVVPVQFSVLATHAHTH